MYIGGNTMFRFDEEYVIQKLKELLAIDSTTGYFRPIQDFSRKLPKQCPEYEKDRLKTVAIARQHNAF